MSPRKERVIVRVMCGPGGMTTPHDGRYVVRWNPHTRYGTCSVETTEDRRQARRFTAGQALDAWRTISHVEPVRPDGLPNRPLSGLTIDMINISEEQQR
jgi:hypothetical protein